MRLFVTEQVSKLHHLNIVRYNDFRVRRDRDTGIVIERASWLDANTISHQNARVSAARQSQVNDIEAPESVVDSLHSLRLAHNDINLHNIMIKNGMPVLIDFGSCQPFGKQLSSHETPAWTEEMFYMSEMILGTEAIPKIS